MQLKNKKIAIIHDSLSEMGGAERLLFKLLAIFPQADLYSSLIEPKILSRIKKKHAGKINYSKLSRLPLAINQPSLFKPYFYHYYWPKLNLDDYDLVISSSHSFCANWVKVKNFHLSYIHTPPRFLYEGVNQWSWLKKPAIKWLFEPYFSLLRKIDQQNDLILTNSKNVQARIKRLYQKSALILYPPFADWTKKQNPASSNKKAKNYYLFFSRLAKQKGIDLVLEAFKNSDRQLLIVGGHKNFAKMARQTNKNIKFLNFVSDQQLPKIIAGARALIYPALDEDFGMAVVEALSQGIPVIAHYSGGPQETLTKKCALFFKEYNVDALKKAIKQFEQQQFRRQDCRAQAEKFIKVDFAKELKKIIKEHVS